MSQNRKWLQQDEIPLLSTPSDRAHISDGETMNSSTPQTHEGNNPTRWLFRFFCMLFIVFCAFMLADLGASLLDWWGKNPALALFLGGLSALALACALLWISSEINEYKRIKQLDRVRAALEAAVTSQQGQAVRHVLVELARDYGQHFVLEARLQHTQDIPSMLAEAEHILFAEADAHALVIIRRALRDLSIGTALIPSPFFDALFMVGRGSMLLRDIARCYGLRPGIRGIYTLWYALLSGAALVASIDLASETMQESLNDALPPALKGAGAFMLPAGQALIAALRTSRLGLAAICLCRPLPFDKSTFPSTWELVRGIFPDLRKNKE